MDENGLAQRLRDTRTERQISQERLAVEVGVSWSTINRYERGVTTPSLNRLRVIADVLHVSVADLIEGAA